MASLGQPTTTYPDVLIAAQPAAASLQQRVLRATVWLCLSVMLLSRISISIVDVDIFHEMALIRESIAIGHIPTVDRFAYTPTLPYSVQHEWGAGVIAYFVATWSGAAGLLVLKYLLAALLAWFCVETARSRSADFLPAFALLAPVGIFFVGDAFSPVRAHLYSIVFTACLLRLLERDRKGDRRWIATWLPLTLVWLNVHAGFVAGMLLIGACWLEQVVRGERARHLPLAAAGMAAIAILNPYGVHYYGYLFRGLTMARPAIGEWMPLFGDFPSASPASVAFLLSLIPIVYALWKNGLRGMPGIGILAATAVEFVLHGRMGPFYAVAFMCYAPGYVMSTPAGARLKSWFDRPPQILQVAWLVAAIFFLNITLTYRPWTLKVPGQGRVDQPAFPNGVVEYLSSRQFHGNVMAPFEYGAYMSWKLYPAVRVAVDSRYEVAYPNWWVEQTFRFYNAEPGWKETLANYPTDVVCVRNTQPLAQAMKETAWKRVYTDGAYQAWARPGLALDVVDRHDQVSDGRFP